MSLYAFVNNAPVALIDALGRVARGGCMQMNCLNPCQKFRQMQVKQEIVTSTLGALSAAGGVKFVCMWAADDEKNQRAKQILKNALAHTNVCIYQGRVVQTASAVSPL